MSEQWIESYRRDGFVVLERQLPAELIDAHVDACDRILNARGLSTRPDQAGDPNISLNEALSVVNVDNPEFQPLFLYTGLRRQVAKLLDDEDPILAGSMTNIWEKAREPHADTLMLLRDPPEKVCRAWCALEDIDPECGAFYVIPGTQRAIRLALYSDVLGAYPEILETLSAYDAGAELAWRDNRFIWRKYRDALSTRIAGLPRQPFVLRKGDVVLFDPDAVHGTMPVTKPELTRKAIIAEWHGREVRSYPSTSYFGPRFDRRLPQTGKRTFDQAISSPLGWYVPRSAQ